MIANWTSLFLGFHVLAGLIYAIFDASAFVAPFLTFPIVSPMEHKRDATVAGLAWPSNPTRGLAPTDPAQVPDTQAAAFCHSDVSDPPTNTTSGPLATDSTALDPGTTIHSDTYSCLAPPDILFPTEPSSTHNYLHRAHFSSRVVHQIQFKIFTHSNNTRELFIEEIPLSGLSRCRDPEHYFYGLSGNWEWSLRTADYWRHHFEIPLVHGHHPFHNVPIETTAPTEATRFTPTIQDLAQQLSITLRAAMASGETNDTWRALEDMSFRDAIETLQAGTSLPSE